MTISAAKLLLLKARLTEHAPFMEERISDATKLRIKLKHHEQKV